MPGDGGDSMVAVAMFAVGAVIAYLSIIAVTLLATGEGVLAAGEADSFAGAAAGLGIIFYIALVAPFLAVVTWASIHGVEVTVVGYAVDPVPLLGLIDGGLELLHPILLFVLGVVVATQLGGSGFNRVVNGTLSAVAMYVLGATVLVLGTAVLFNVVVDVLFDALAGGLGATGRPDAGPPIHYLNPVAGLLQVGLSALPFVAAGTVTNAVLAWRNGDDAAEELVDAPTYLEDDGPEDGTSNE
jgi:hypothetical protein